MAKGKTIKPKEYQKIKDLVALGLTNKQVLEICQISDVTLWYIKKSSNFEDFRNRPKKQQEPKQVKVTFEDTSVEARLKSLEARVSWLESEARKPVESDKKSSWYHMRWN